MSLLMNLKVWVVMYTSNCSKKASFQLEFLTRLDSDFQFAIA